MNIRKVTTALSLAGALLGVGTHASRAAEGPLKTPVISVHGYMLNRIYSAPGTSPEYRAERISVSTIAVLPNASTAYVELYYHPWAPTPFGTSGIYLESAYYDAPLGGHAQGSTLGEYGNLRVGKGRRLTFGITPAYPNRKTTNYGIVSEAFTQDRIQGVQYYYVHDYVDSGITVQTGYRLGVRQIGEIPGDTPRNATHQVPHLAFRDPQSGSGVPDTRQNQKLGIAARLGGVWPVVGLRGGISGYLGTLDNQDLVNLTTSAPGNVLSPVNPLNPGAGPTPALLPAGTTSHKMNVLGLDLSYKNQPTGIVAQGEWYSAKVSTLPYKAWNALVGWEADGMNSWRAYVRYGRQDMGIARTANPLTWDTEQWSLSFVQPLYKNVWLQYEAEINNEQSNTGAHVKNNLYFVELFSGF